MAAKIDLYNDALRHLGETKLSGLSEAREPRYALDDAYAAALDACLEQGAWNFAMRAVKIDASVSVVPTFGWANAFAKPADWKRTHIASASETFDPPLNRFADEYDHWYADIDPLYVMFVSNDVGYGLDLTRWPQTFADFVALELADRVCLRLTSSESKLERILTLKKRARVDARSKDALNQPNERTPLGSWARSRLGNANRGRSSSGGMTF